MGEQYSSPQSNRTQSLYLYIPSSLSLLRMRALVRLLGDLIKLVKSEDTLFINLRRKEFLRIFTTL